MKDLGCPLRFTPNWKYMNRADVRYANPSIPVVGKTIHCYSQRDLEAGQRNKPQPSQILQVSWCASIEGKPSFPVPKHLPHQKEPVST